MGIRRHPIRRDLFVLNSMQVNPRVVEITNTRRPRNPEKIVIIVVRKIISITDIFV